MAQTRSLSFLPLKIHKSSKSMQLHCIRHLHAYICTYHNVSLCTSHMPIAYAPHNAYICSYLIVSPYTSYMHHKMLTSLPIVMCPTAHFIFTTPCIHLYQSNVFTLILFFFPFLKLSILIFLFTYKCCIVQILSFPQT